MLCRLGAQSQDPAEIIRSATHARIQAGDAYSVMHTENGRKGQEMKASKHDFIGVHLHNWTHSQLI